jgi:hypothetical protein
MHRATHLVPRDLPRRDDLTIPNRKPFEAALTELDEAWSGGPYTELARQLIRDRTAHLDETFARYDALVPHVLSTVDSWVVTHGEPHAGNVMTLDGDIALIDWDTLALAPRERDLWMIEPHDAHDRAAYSVAADPAAMELYRCGGTSRRSVATQRSSGHRMPTMRTPGSRGDPCSVISDGEPPRGRHQPTPARRSGVCPAGPAGGGPGLRVAAAW